MAKRKTFDEYKEERMWQVRKMNCGMEATIIDYYKIKDSRYHRVDVKFKDGNITKNRLYDSFKAGSISPSFGGFLDTLEGGINAYWNFDKNDELGISPHVIAKNSHEKPWLFCNNNDLHNYDIFGVKKGFQMNCYDFCKSIENNNSGCTYCGISKNIHWSDSIGYYMENLEGGLNTYWSWKNGDLDPYTIGQGSNIKVWILCQNKETPYHNDDGGYQTDSISFCKGYGCSMCELLVVHKKDSLASKYPDIAKMIAIKENNLSFDDCYNIAPNHDAKYYVKCPKCGMVSTEKKRLPDILRGHTGCEFCSDGKSIPNKWFAYIFIALGRDNFTLEFSPKWLEKKRMDITFCKEKKAYEINGNYGNHESDEGQAIDTWKKNQMESHGYKVITIDLTKNYKDNEFECLKENTIKYLGDKYDLSNIDWDYIWLKCQKSLMIEACKLYEYEKRAVKEISEILKVHRSTVTRYLKRGKEIGLCPSYSESESKSRGSKYRNKCSCISI